MDQKTGPALTLLGATAAAVVEDGERPPITVDKVHSPSMGDETFATSCIYSFLPKATNIFCS